MQLRLANLTGDVFQAGSIGQRERDSNSAGSRVTGRSNFFDLAGKYLAWISSETNLRGVTNLHACCGLIIQADAQDPALICSTDDQYRCAWRSW